MGPSTVNGTNAAHEVADESRERVHGGRDPDATLAKGIVDRHQECEHGHSARSRRGGSGGKDGCQSKTGGSGNGGTGSIFEQIALAMGKAMDKKLDQLLDAANQVSALGDQKAGGADAKGPGGQGGDSSQILQASTLVTARGQELGSISQAGNSTLNSLGLAVQTAAKKT
jgi:hypothetical protein